MSQVCIMINTIVYGGIYRVMRKVELRMNEQEKYEVIKELVDKKGNKKRAALKLRLSVRQINRLIKVYKEKGKSGFLHQNRNRKPVNSLPQELTDYIVKLYRDVYQGFNFKHFRDMLEDRENIVVSYSFIYKLMIKNNITSPKIQKATKKKIIDNAFLLTEKLLKESIDATKGKEISEDFLSKIKV